MEREEFAVSLVGLILVLFLRLDFELLILSRHPRQDASIPSFMDCWASNPERCAWGGSTLPSEQHHQLRNISLLSQNSRGELSGTRLQALELHS